MYGTESILIVEARDTGLFSKLLYNLIGADNGSNGVLSANVDASIFTETQFMQNPIMSSQKIVFVGCPKGASDYIQAIRFENDGAVDEDGVYIGVKGNQACITVGKEPPSKEVYWKFLETAERHGQKFDDLLAPLRLREDTSAPGDDADKNPVLDFAGRLGKAISNGASGVNENVVIRQKASKIREQRYQYAVKRFYKEMLEDFAEA